VTMEYRRAARRDADRADLMRRAASLLRELHREVKHWDLTSHDDAVESCCAALERSARQATEDALVEWEDTDPVGLKL
jgi:hypothetical protein